MAGAVLETDRIAHLHGEAGQGGQFKGGWQLKREPAGAVLESNRVAHLHGEARGGSRRQVGIWRVHPQKRIVYTTSLGGFRGT